MEENERNILQQRAKKLAETLSEKEQVETYLEVLCFKLAEEFYALEIKYIREVYPHREYTPLPGVPPFILGLINVRRRILSIIDLKVPFSLAEKDFKEKKLVIIADDKKEFALITDGIIGVKKIDFTQIQSVLPTLIGLRAEFLKGITADRIAILDGEKLLSSRQLMVEETVEL